jgi:iron complex outermembrane receptor protein
LTLSSSSPAANANGFIDVSPGDHIPLMPEHRFVFDAEYSATPQWKVGADLRYESSQFLVGDESNQEPKMPGYATVNLHTSYKIIDRVMVFGEIDNVFDRHYFTYGTFTQLDGLASYFNLTDPRTFTPAAGRAFYAGAKVTF